MEEKEMILNVIGLVIGVMILGAGIYYLVKNKDDKESRKIYGITTIVGAVITVIMIAKFFI